LAGFKGRKMLLIEQAKAEQGVVNDQQQEEADRKAAEQANQDNQANKTTIPQPTGPGF
jgi:hypothetical protein